MVKAKKVSQRTSPLIREVSLLARKKHPLGYVPTCPSCPGYSTKIYVGMMSEEEGWELASRALELHYKSPMHRVGVARRATSPSPHGA